MEGEQKLRYPTYLWCLFHAINNNGALFSCHTPSGDTLRLGPLYEPCRMRSTDQEAVVLDMAQASDAETVATVRNATPHVDVPSLTT
jgi:hypothetical protein